MDRISKSLFDVVAQGDDVLLQRLLLEDKEERNIATLAVSSTPISFEVTSAQFNLHFSTETLFCTRQLGTGSVDA